MSKYHAAVTCSSANLSAFSLRGFYLGITCGALGYKLDVSKKVKAPDTDMLPVADTMLAVPGADVASSSGHTLKAAAVAQDIQLGVNTNPVNQLHSACIDFNDLANWNKQNIISKVLTPVGSYNGKQSASLRNLDATIPWETSNLRQLCTNVNTYQCSMRRRTNGRTIAWTPVRAEGRSDAHADI